MASTAAVSETATETATRTPSKTLTQEPLQTTTTVTAVLPVLTFCACSTLKWRQGIRKVTRSFHMEIPLQSRSISIQGGTTKLQCGTTCCFDEGKTRHFHTLVEY